ncbi:ExbD/TolR family protein [Mariniflexile gromovii]|uniref:Biopolymer transporter ExbD n=1 Tax=Mariniflexile gromovii TaxID=362523 RepID=A0ABS4BP27_9FLAO|nr:biopolymer transporter ExbD [Mariniflexile gromovii]MBP0902348.1 biopolymer transporter ExbD [Mariniflexile gromovii]
MRHSKLMPEVNAGSMADIAFLLLIFFLVTATISSDEGINRVLPEECPPGIDCSSPIIERNVLKIIINNDDEIMIGNQIVPIEALKNTTKNFIDNNGDNTCGYCNGEKSSMASENPTKAVVSLQTGQQTSYKRFIEVQNELSKAYYELRKVKEAYPFTLIETENN